MIDEDLRSRRLAVVREHMASENEQDFDRTIATFRYPRYELMATGDTYDGEAAVREYFRRSRATFPDQRNENAVLHATDHGVVAEFDLVGTHAELGTTMRTPMVALFIFEPGGDRIVCERVYFDTASIRRQLVGDDPSV